MVVDSAPPRQAQLQMDESELAGENRAKDARIDELEQQLLEMEQKKNDRIFDLEGQLKEAQEELITVKKQKAEFDEENIELREKLNKAHMELDQASVALGQAQEMLGLVQEELEQAIPMINLLEEALEAAHNDFVNLVHQIEHHLPQLVEDPEEIQGLSGIDYEEIPTTMDEDVLSDADSTRPSHLFPLQPHLDPMVDHQ